MIFKKNVCLLQIRNGQTNSAKKVNAKRMLLTAKLQVQYNNLICKLIHLNLVILNFQLLLVDFCLVRACVSRNTQSAERRVLWAKTRLSKITQRCRGNKPLLYKTQLGLIVRTMLPYNKQQNTLLEKQVFFWKTFSKTLIL